MVWITIFQRFCVFMNYNFGLSKARVSGRVERKNLVLSTKLIKYVSFSTETISKAEERQPFVRESQLIVGCV